MFACSFQLRLLPPTLSDLPDLSGPSGALKLWDNPLSLPIQDQFRLGPEHLARYLAGDAYAAVYRRHHGGGSLGRAREGGGKAGGK